MLSRRLLRLRLRLLGGVRFLASSSVLVLQFFWIRSMSFLQSLPFMPTLMYCCWMALGGLLWLCVTQSRWRVTHRPSTLTLGDQLTK
ncbi:hypothetical protein D3C85_1526920 [compost metagenome]